MSQLDTLNSIDLLADEISTNADAYTWIGTSGGSWDSAGNWKDTTSGQNPATSFPGSGNAVTIAGPTGSVYEAIDGGGASASLSLTGHVDLVGSYTTGALTVGTGYIAVGLALAAGTTLSAAAVNVDDGQIAVSGTLNASQQVKITSGSLSVSGSGAQATLADGLVLGSSSFSDDDYDEYYSGSLGSVSIVSGAAMAVTGAVDDIYGEIYVSGTGSHLTTSGSMTLSGADGEDSLEVSSSGLVQVAALLLQQSGYSAANGDYTEVYVDTTATLEVGTAGSAAAGAITVDAGYSIEATASAELNAKIINNGTISETAGALAIAGSLSGTGQVQIGAGATLDMDGTASASITIDFSSSATLVIGAYNNTTYAIAATLSGLTTGDVIIVDDATITSAIYSYAGNNTGTLTLRDGTATIETLTLAGNYSQWTFLVSPTTGGASAVSVLARPVSNAPSSEAVVAGVATPLSGFNVSDTNTQATSITVTLNDTSGKLSTSDSGGSSITGSGTTQLQISGTVAQVDADLATLTYLASSSGSDTITVNAIDSLGSQSLQTNVTVTILPAAPPCYCRGTRILTDRGEVAVEDLVVGQRVRTLFDPTLPAKEIAWIGRCIYDASRHPRPDEVLPIRIRANALANGLPKRDLLVSPGHCLKLDGVLIQAERLVNGATIIRDRSLAQGEYFHVEVAGHDILLAEGVPAESYLDVGNRSNFVNSQGVVALHPDLSPQDCQDTCLPLVTSGPLLAAIKQRLSARVSQIGYFVSNDPVLRVLVDGKCLKPYWTKGEHFCFVIPENSVNIRLTSRTWVPGEFDPACEDLRQLGVCLRRLVIDGVTIKLDDVRLQSGWYSMENDGNQNFRWTSGEAQLPSEATHLMITLGGARNFWTKQKKRAPITNRSANSGKIAIPKRGMRP